MSALRVTAGWEIFAVGEWTASMRAKRQPSRTSWSGKLSRTAAIISSARAASTVTREIIANSPPSVAMRLSSTFPPCAATPLTMSRTMPIRLGPVSDNIHDSPLLLSFILSFIATGVAFSATAVAAIRYKLWARTTLSPVAAPILTSAPTIDIGANPRRASHLSPSNAACR